MSAKATPQGSTMKAIVYREYGSPDVLGLQEVAKPVPKDDEVLVRVQAASLNPLDWHLLRGLPYIVRPTAGWLKPKRNIPGVDVAGIVEAVGGNVRTSNRVTRCSARRAGPAPSTSAGPRSSSCASRPT